MPYYGVVKINPDAEAPSDAAPGDAAPEASKKRPSLLSYFAVGGVLLAVLSCCVAAFWVRNSAAERQPTPSPANPAPVLVNYNTATHAAPTDTPDPDTLPRTATFVAALFQPAREPLTDTSRILVGTVLLQPGCSNTNIALDASGARYYLYLPASFIINVNPSMQLAEIRGEVTRLPTCIYPVIRVNSFTWLNQYATPSPLTSSPFTNSATITTTRRDGWLEFSTPYPIRPVVAGAMMMPTSTPMVTATQTPYPTYTPYPTFTYIPPPKTPLATEPPTATPTNTPTATPQAVTLYGAVETITGCLQTNFAINAAGTTYPVIMGGVSLPPGDPTTYHALVIGVVTTVCGTEAIKATNITWYNFTPTPTPTTTLTATLTPTETATPPQTPTETSATATGEPSLEPTKEATTEPTPL